MGNERDDPGVSRLFEEVFSLAQYTNAKAAFAFVIESDRGDSGCPVYLVKNGDPRELKRLQRKLGLVLRAIADGLLKQAGED